MALSKGRAAITQMTASGTSTTISISTVDGQTLLISHSNGTGTVTAFATIAVQVQASGGTLWYTIATYQASTTAASVDTFACKLVDEFAAVRLIYTAPTGPTGFTLDAECATIVY